MSFLLIPKGAVFCHYAKQSNGAYAVVTPSGKVLGPSFYAIREQFEFFASVSGAGAWVAIVPRSSSFSQERAIQPGLF